MSEHPKVWLAELARDYGASTIARGCGELISGSELSRTPPSQDELVSRLGGGPGAYAVDRQQQGNPLPDYWPRVWGARGLLYVWDDAVEPDVVAGLDDRHWRVRELCAKVAALRELGSAASRLGALLGDETPRVRAAAVRALGGVAETEQLEAVRVTLDDPEPTVARAAERALAQITERLDLPEER